MENKRLYKYRLGEERFNNQGCLMRIVEYNKANDIIVEFQDKYKGKIHTNYKAFLKKRLKTHTTHLYLVLV